MSEALAQFPLPWLMGVALALFLVSFGGIAWSAYHPSEKKKHDYLAHLPLEEGKNG